MNPYCSFPAKLVLFKDSSLLIRFKISLSKIIDWMLLSKLIRLHQRSMWHLYVKRKFVQQKQKTFDKTNQTFLSSSGNIYFCHLWYNFETNLSKMVGKSRYYNTELVLDPNNKKFNSFSVLLGSNIHDMKELVPVPRVSYVSELSFYLNNKHCTNWIWKIWNWVAL